MENLKDELINKYNENLINIIEEDIILLDLGFINDNKCNLMIFPILIHCIENIEIFNNKQLNNITNFLNILNYGQ